MSVHPKDAALAAQYVADMDEIQALRNHVALLTSELETLRKAPDVVRLQADYIKLLEAELAEMAPLIHVYGWKSSRYELGEQLRAKIKAAMAMQPTSK